MTCSTPVLSYNNQFLGLSYADSYRQDFKHLRTDPIHRGPSRTSPTPISSAYIAQPPHRSMVRAPSSKPKPRSAGQAPSPQHIARNAPSDPRASRRVSPKLEQTSHGIDSRTSSSVVNNMRHSPESTDESDSSSDCCTCSEDEHETDFSSRATSPDDDFDIGEDVLARRKRQIVDGSMLLFRLAVYHWFAEVWGVTTHAGEGGRGTKRSADKISGRQSASQSPTGGKKRTLRSDEGDGVGGGDDSDQEGEGKFGKKKNKPDPRFACPYYKHDPVKYRTHRTCPGPGFINVHRVKEHLIRKHLKPTYTCLECNENCGTMARLTDHLRSPANCSKQKHSLPDGIDDAKLKLLKARHKGQMTERQKWERMYHILFPDDDRLPTPYYDVEAEAEFSDAYHLPEEMSRVARYIRLEVFPRARRELEREVDRELEGVSERVRNKAIEMYEGAIFKVMRVSQYGHQQGQLSSLPSSPKTDSGVATPEPAENCAQPVLDFPNLPQNTLENSFFNNYDFFSFPGPETFPQDLPGVFAARLDDDGCASASNRDSAYETVRDDCSVGLLLDLPSLGF